MVDASGAPQLRALAQAKPAHIQPDEASPAIAQVPKDSRLDRILGDAEMLYALQVSGYAPDKWQRPSEEFARYGYDVMTGWIFNGRIWTEVHKKFDFHLKRPDEPFDEDTVHDLASDTVVVALDAFLEHVLKKNKWDPSRGASLKTFFVGQCCLQFPNVLRAYRRELRKHPIVDLHADPTDFVFSSEPGPEVILLENERITGLLATASSSRARDVLALQVAGYSHDEIAAILQMPNAKAVENTLGYNRRKAKERLMEEEAG